MIKENVKIDWKKEMKIINNVINIDKFCSDRHFNYLTLLLWGQYFDKKGNYNLVSYDENDCIKAILIATIKDNPNCKIDLEKAIAITPKEKQFIEFRKRISSAYKNITISMDAELEFFSSIDKNKGIGTQLIKKFESKLKNEKINQYFLYTNELCNFQWYFKNGYELIKKSEVDISDLNLIFPNRESIWIMVFKKVL